MNLSKVVKATVSERTFYPPLMDVIRLKGGSAVSEVQYNSVPDIVFELGGTKWLLSIKIGQDPKTLKDGILQYIRHKDESGINLGILLLLSESVRKTPVSASKLSELINTTKVSALVDADQVKDQIADRPFPEVLDFVIEEVLSRRARGESTYYPLSTVISILRQHVTEMMDEIKLTQKTILGIITNRSLLMGLSHLPKERTDAVARFLASYIFLTQILFLRLLNVAKPDLLNIPTPVSHNIIRKAFAKVLDVNYRPIYELDVLDSISTKFLDETFTLIWGLVIEQVRYELPGRIFHQLMPTEIRKLLAAFYTRPQAAELLAQLTLSKSGDTVYDPACGSGTILTAAYRRKLELSHLQNFGGDPHKRFCEEELFGSDIMPFAVHLTSANLAAMNPALAIDRTQIIQGDALQLKAGPQTAGLQMGLNLPRVDGHPG